MMENGESDRLSPFFFAERLSSASDAANDNQADRQKRHVAP